MRSICKWRVFGALSFVLVAWSARGERLKIFTLRPPAQMSENGRALKAARGDFLRSGTTVSIGNQGALAFEGVEGARVSILGPAEFQYWDQAGSSILLLRYGDLYVKSGADHPFKIQVGSQSIESKDRETEIYLEVHPSTGALRLRNVGDHEVTFAGQKVENRQILQISPAGAKWISSLESDDLKRVESRHENIRIGQAPLAPVELVEKVKSKEPLHFMIKGGWIAGVSRFSPEASGSSFTQDLGSFGAFGRLAFRWHFGVEAGEPRNHFLSAPTLEIGVELMAHGAWLGLSSSSQSRSTNWWAIVPIGFSYKRFQVTLLPSAVWFDSRHTIPAEMKLPITLGAEFEYRIDIGSWTDSEAGVSLGARYFYTPMVADPTPLGATIVPSNFAWQFAGIYSALSYRF